MIVHVAQDAIRRNAKHGTNDPAIIVRRGSKAERHHEVDIVGPDGQVIGTFHYQPHQPLSCGARVWLSLEKGYDATPRPLPDL